MDELDRKAQHRLAAMDTTNKLQTMLVFEDKWRGLVENSIYELLEDAYQRGHQYPPKTA